MISAIRGYEERKVKSGNLEISDKVKIGHWLTSSTKPVDLPGSVVQVICISYVSYVYTSKCVQPEVRMQTLGAKKSAPP